MIGKKNGFIRLVEIIRLRLSKKCCQLMTVFVELWEAIRLRSDGKESACNAREEGLRSDKPLFPVTSRMYLPKKKKCSLSVRLKLDLGEGSGTPLHTLAWKIPWMEEPGGLQSMGSQRIGHDWGTELNWFSVMQCSNSSCGQRSHNLYDQVWSFLYY